MTKYILAEECVSDFDYSQASIVALTAVASASFGFKNIGHTTIEDYYDEAEMRCNESQYFKDQLQWFMSLDSFLKENFRFCSEHHLNLASAYHNRFIYLFDFLVMRYYRIDQFLRTAKPSELCIISRRPGNEQAPELEAFSRYDRWSYVPVIKLIAEKRGIPINFIETSSSELCLQPQNQGISTCITLNFMRAFKKILFLTNALNEKLSSPGSGTVYIPEIGNFATQKCFKTLKKMNQRVLTRHTFKHSKSAQPNRSSKIDGDNSQQESKEFKPASVLNWGGIHTDPILVSLIWPYVEHFIKVKTPLIIEEIRQLSDFFIKEKVRLIIAHASVGSCTTALLAAKVLGLPRICFQHSIGVADSESWLMDEINLFDRNFAMSTISKNYFVEAQTTVQNPNCLIGESSDYLHDIKKSYSTQTVKKKKSNTIQLLYCPSKLATNGIAHFTTFYYPMSWYFKFQCSMLTFLSKIENCQIIYKHLNNQTWANQSVIPWLKSQSFTNITVLEGSLKDFFDRADRVLFDYPSTGFFESLAAGKPVLALYHEAVKIWPAMLSQFQASLQSYSSPIDAYEKVFKFIQSPGKEYQPYLELGTSDIKYNLEQIVKELNV